MWSVPYFILWRIFVLCFKPVFFFIVAMWLYKVLPVIKIFDRKSFFIFFIFIRHLTRLVVIPLFNFEFGYYTCLSNNSLISLSISTKFVSVFVLCMLYNSNNFQAKANILTYLKVNFTQKVESSHNPYSFQLFCIKL